MASYSAQIVGKNIDLGETFKSYSDSKISEIINKYSVKTISYKATLQKKIIDLK